MGCSAAARAVEVGPDGLVYVAGADIGRVVRFDPVDGSMVDVLVEVDAGLVNPRALAFDGDGNLLVASSGTDEVVAFDAESGKRLGVVAAEGLDNPGGMIVGEGELLYVTSQNTDSIIGYAYDTDDEDELEVAIEIPTDPGSGPVDLIAHPDGGFIVAMAGLGRIDTVTMPAEESGGDDAEPNVEPLIVDAGLVTPTAVSIGTDGALWVADHWSGTVRRFDPETGEDLGFEPDLSDGSDEMPTTDRTTDASFGPADIAFIDNGEHADDVDIDDEDSSDGRRRPGPRSRAWLRNQPPGTGELRFIPANGAADPGVEFGARGRSYDALLTSNAAFLLAGGTEPDDAVVMTVVGGADDVAGITVEESPLAPDEATIKSAGEAVSFAEVIPGVDLAYASADGHLEYGFVVAPGTDPVSIRLGFEGVSDVSIRDDGELLIDSVVGRDFRSTVPYTFQRTVDGVVEVSTSYVVYDDGTVGFEFGSYDSSLPLVIDPTFVAVDAASGSYTSGSTIDLPVPAIVATDDLMIAQIAYNATGGGIITPPAGWTLIDETGGNGVTQALYYRVATASEPTTYSFTLSSGATDTASGAITLYDGVDTASPIDASGAQSNASAAAVTAPSISTTAANATLVAFYAVRDDGNGTPPAGMTERTDVNSAQGGAAADETLALSADETLGSAGSTGARTATTDATAGSIGALVALTPASGGGGATNLVMVTNNGNFASGNDSAKRTLFQSWGWTVTAVDGTNTSALTSAAASNDVMFLSDTAGGGSATIRTLDIGVVNENFSAWPTLLYSSSGDQNWNNNTTIDIVDNGHYITSPFSTGSLTIHTSSDDVNYWEAGANPLPSGVTSLADSPTSTNDVALHVAETGATLYSSNTAVNRRVWFPSDAANPSVFTTDYETLLERSLDWAAGNDAASVPVSPTVTVNSTGDSGDSNIGDDLCDTGGTNADGDPECTLRAAIEEADASATVDGIRFIIPTTDSGHASGIWTIGPASAYPWVGSEINIDATTQPDYTTTPVVVLDGSALSGTERGLGFNIAADDSRVAGLSIHSFPDDNISSGADRIVIEDNHIGVLPNGTTAPGSGSENVAVWGGVDAVVRNNLIAASGGVANVAVTGSGTSATVENNIIGTDPSGTLTFGGGQGIWTDATGSVTISGNTVAYNTWQGVQVSTGATSVSIVGNEIRDNGMIGIDLVAPGDSGDLVTANDAGDADSGPNGLLNFPVMTSLTESGGTVTADYDLDVPAGNYRIEFFTNPSGADPSGNGEGETFVHAHSITHTGSGAESFSTSFSGSTGQVVTATATVDLGGGAYAATSEFSSAATVTGPPEPVVLDSIQSGTTVLAGGSTSTTATISSVDMSRAFLTFSIRGNDTSPENMSVGGRLSNATTVAFDRIGTSGDVTIEWSVVEFTTGVTVQRGTVTPGGSTTNVAIAAVDLTKSFPLVSMRASGVIYEGEDWVRARLTSNTNLELATDGTFGNVIDWQVIEYNDADVQSGSVSFGTGTSSQSATIAAVDPAKSWLIYNYRSTDGTTTNIGQKLVRGRVTNATTLTFDRSATGQTIDLEYFVVEFSDATTVQSASAALSASATTRNVATTAVDPARSIAVGGYAQTGGRSAYTANDNPGVGWFTTRLTSATNLRVQRDANLAAADLGWFVVHWPCADSDGDGLCDDEEDANTDADDDPSTNPGPDTDGDTTPNYLDADDDGDGTPTASENADPNGDGDPRDAVDSDHDGQPDWLDQPTVPTASQVVAEQKISDTAGGLTAVLDDGDEFGSDTAPVGDLDGDGVVDLIVAANTDDDGGSDRGAVYILFLNADGTVKAEQKISDTIGGFTSPLSNSDQFGKSVAGLGDLDGDGINDAAVGVYLDDDGGSDRGAVYILFLNADGTVKAEQKISDTSGGLATALADFDYFGVSVAGLGDLDGDGVVDIAVGAFGDDDGGSERGATYVLFLNADGTVKAEQKISDTVGGFGGVLDNGDRFGMAAAGIGDLDADGLADVVVGAYVDDDGGTDRGALYVLFLNADGTVKAERKISSTTGGVSPSLADGDRLGRSVTAVGDVDGDGLVDLLASTYRADAGGFDRGAVHVIHLDSDGTSKAVEQISGTAGGFTGPLDDDDRFGRGVAGLGDLDGNGTIDLAVSAYQDDDGGTDRGAVYILDLSVGPAIVAAVDDSDSANTLAATPVNVAANDNDANGDAVTAVDATDPANGTTSTNGDGTVTYTSDPAYAGADAFDYWAIDAGATLSRYWGLAGNGDDGVGTADGTLNGGPATRAGSFGDALAFDETDDYVTIPDFAYNADFTLSFDFTLDNDNSGSLFKYVYSHGDINAFNSINVFINEASHGSDPNVMRTVVRDNDDTLDNSALQFDISSLVNDTGWHTYTLVADSSGGLTVYLDGSVVASDATRGTGGVNPTGSAYLGVRQDLDANRRYRGGLDTVQVYDRALTSSEVADLANQVNVAAVSMTVSGCVDSDSDGLCDSEEDVNTDADNDPSTNPGPDTDGDTTPNYLDADDDGDGTPTALENADPNSDGDPRDALDSDRDGQPDYLDAPITVDTDGTVKAEQKISDTVGGLAATLDDVDYFGYSVSSLGDLDGDGVADLAVGAYSDDDGGTGRGAVYVLFMNPDGTVKAEQKISDTAGGLAAVLDDGDNFGWAVSGVGDLDGDGVVDLAVGTYGDDDGGTNRGAFYVLFMNPDGTVKAEQKISDTAGGLAAVLGDGDIFGSAVSGVGDLDGDGVIDLVVGARRDDDGGPNRGAVYVLFMNPDGTVKAEQKISDTAGGLAAVLDDSDYFGWAVSGVGDLDGDGVADLVAGARFDDDGGTDRGALYVLLLNADGTVKAEQKISDTDGGLAAVLDNGDYFGAAVSGVGDVDGDGVADLVAGAFGDDDGGTGRGAAYVLFMNTDGTIKAEQKISDTTGGLTGTLDDNDYFGVSVSGVGDLDGDGIIDIGVGANRDGDGGPSRGAVYVLNLSPDTTVTVNSTGDASDATPGDGDCDTGGTNSEGDPECTLRAAIEEANASATVDTIHFNIPTSDPGYSASPLSYTFTPSTPYPLITAPTDLDATTQAGYSGDPIVELDDRRRRAAQVRGGR